MGAAPPQHAVDASSPASSRPQKKKGKEPKRGQKRGRQQESETEEDDEQTVEITSDNDQRDGFSHSSLRADSLPPHTQTHSSAQARDSDSDDVETMLGGRDFGT